MEDISRELEKEIESYSSPARIKRKSATMLIAVDDFGKMKPADWIKKFLVVLVVISIFFFLTTIQFYRLYSNYKAECISLRTNLDLAEKKVKNSIKEKEFLMAKLVMSDKKPVKLKIEEKKNITKIIESKVVKVVKKRQIPSAPTSLNKSGSIQGAQKKLQKYRNQPPKDITQAPQKDIQNEIIKPAPSEAEPEQKNIKNVGIDRFVITKDKDTGDVFINFRVLNIASEQGDASGRVFVLLWSKNKSDMNKLVVPTVPLKDNMPAIPRRGQYFSIAHFKSVKFKIRNIPNPELFDKATVFVFGKENKLILNEEINISIGQ